MAHSLSSHALWSGISATTWSSALSTLTADPAIKEIELASAHADTRFFLGRVGAKYLRRIERGELEVLQEVLEPWPSVAETTPPRRRLPFTEPPPLIRPKRSYEGMPPLETVEMQNGRLVVVDDDMPALERPRAMSLESVDSMPSLIHPPDAHHIIFCTACDEEIDGLRVGNLCAPCWQEACGCEEEVKKEDWYFHTPPMPTAFDMYHPHTLLQFLNFVTSINMYAKRESSMFFFDMIPKELAAAMLDHPWVSGETSLDDSWNGGPATAKEVHDLKTLLSDYVE